ncbi:MAG: hypothetical protein ACP5NC_07135 [Nitrososphaeria archaeon]
MKISEVITFLTENIKGLKVSIKDGPARSWGTPSLNSTKIGMELGIKQEYGLPNAFLDYINEIKC